MIIDGLLLLSHHIALLALLAGTAVGLVLGIMPGVSGRTGLIVLAPLMIGVDPLFGAVFLLAMHAVVHTSGSIPAILVGVPTSSAEAATVLDGYALTRRGRSGLSIGISLGASALGGCLGAAALICMVYAFRPLIVHIGQPEILMLSLLGLAMVASLSAGRVAEGIASAALGVLAGCVGLDAASGTPRYVASVLELWDGLDIPALVTGLFVVPELMSRQGVASGSKRAGTTRLRHALMGIAATWRRWGLLLRASAIGIVVGVIPGMGAAIAVWLAYGHAVQSTHPRVPFGRGAAEGVLAPESANNSKEGGSLAPTLFLGIPGSSSMAIMLAAFAGMGLRPGSHWLGSDAPFTAALAWTIALANVIAVPACLAAAPLMGLFALRARRVMPAFAVCAATATTLYAAPFASTLVQLAVFGLIGCAMRAGNWPRPPFVLGFVVGPLIEGALHKTIALYGWDAMARPGAAIGALLVLASIAYGFRRGAGQAARGAPGWDVTLGLAAIAIGAAAAWQAQGFPTVSALLPQASAILLGAAGASALALPRLRRRVAAAPEHAGPAGEAILASATLAAATWLAGLPLAAGLFVSTWLVRRESLPLMRAALFGLAAAVSLALAYALTGARSSLMSGLAGGLR